MNTLKSAALVIVLLGVLYGVYVVLSKPPAVAPQGSEALEDDGLAPPLVEYSTPGESQPAATVPGGEVAASAADHEDAGHSHGGTYQPNLDSPATLPPPTSVPTSEPPADATLTEAASGTRRSSYEAPAGGSNSASPAPGGAPPLETTAESAPAGQPYEPSAESQHKLAAWSLKQDWQAAEQLVAEGRFREALAKLSPYYGHADLTADEHAQLVPWLDALAAKVIYSREHLATAAYQVRRGETLFDVANTCQVPVMLLASINRDQVSDPQVLVPGTMLKVVPGPFRADVNLTTSELTLFLGDLYAGRFPFAVGSETPPPGTYKALDKRRDRTYYAADGRTIPANDPANPYGSCWIDLGREVSIHGSPASSNPSVAPLGCISLSPRDAEDVFGILSVGSAVTIRR